MLPTCSQGAAVLKHADAIPVPFVSTTTTPALRRLVGGAILTAAAAEAVDLDPATILRRWFDGLSPSSLRIYRRAVRDFAAWAIADGDHGAEAVLRMLVSAGLAGSTGLLERWRDHLLAAGKAPNTVCSCLSGICSMLGAARRAGLMQWRIERVSPKPERRNDRSGPPRHAIEAIVGMLDELADAGDRRAARDVAIVRLLFCCALRRNEVCTLRLADLHLDDAEPFAQVLRKGNRERVRVLLSSGSVASLHRWLAMRGDVAGPVFHRMRQAPELHQLDGVSVWRMLDARRRQAGIKGRVRPHGLRHSAASEVARRGSLSELRAIGGWRSLSSVQHYLDDRQEERQRAMALVDL